VKVLAHSSAEKAGIPHSNREIKLLVSSFDDTFGTRNTGRQNCLFKPTAACSNPPGFTMLRALAKHTRPPNALLDFDRKLSTGNKMQELLARTGAVYIPAVHSRAV
jgi:hypothetical protein